MSFEAALAEVLPPGALLLDAEAKRPFECDGLSAYCAMPRVVCLPENAAQVREVLRLCREHAVPIVPRGAGTGLSGGALPLREGCVLSLARLNRILEIDVANGVAVVDELAGTLDQITASAQEAATLIARVSAANVQQADGVGQLHTAVDQMNDVTQSNAATAEETAAASAQITAQARGLSDMADELSAMVKGSGSQARADLRRGVR